MRILWFNLATDSDDPVLGFTTRWLQALAKRVTFIYVITMRAGLVEVPENVRVYSVGKEKGYGEPRRALIFYQNLLRILAEGNIDVCFSHMIPIFTVLAAPVLRAKGIPLVTWYAHPSLTWTLKLAHHLSDRVIASLATAYPYRHDKLTVVGQGIDTDLFASDGMASDEPPSILCVGRLSPVKDHPTLITAGALLRERWKRPFRMVIVGGPSASQDEPYVQALHEQVRRLRLQDVVTFEPPVPMAALPGWYRQCTVHVNMAPIGSGDKVAWEAMSCGRPCLMANEGFRETLGTFAGHLLFRHGDPGDLANKLMALLALAEKDRTQIGLYLRQQVVRMHSLDSLACKLIGLFQTVRRC